jgi:hypothetical protein
MLKKEERILIRTALMEYRKNLFKTFHGLDEEKKTLRWSQPHPAELEGLARK